MKNKKTLSYLALMKYGTKKKAYSFEEIGTIISTLIEDLYDHHFRSSKYNTFDTEGILKQTV